MSEQIFLGFSREDASDFAVAAYIISVSLNDLMHGVNCFKAYNGNILAS